MYLAVQQQTADPKEVIPQRELILKNNPEDTTNKFNLARLYMEDNQPQKAEALFMELWKDPSFDKTVTTKALADFYIKTQRYTDGVNLMENYLAQAEDKIDAYIIYAKFLAAFDEDQAAKAFQKAIDMNPADGRGYLALADFKARQGNFEQAAELMKKYLADHPDSQADTLVAVRYEIEAGQLDAAEKELNTILARNAENAEAVMLVGEVAFRRGDYNKAESFFNKAISLDEKNGDFYYRRFRLRRVNGDLDQARRDIQAACQYSINPAYNMQLGIVNEELGDLPAAEIVYRDLLEKWPNQVAATTRLMGIFFQQKRWTQMSELLTQAKSRFPRDPYFPMMEAKMELSRGQINPAMTSLESCLRLDPNYLEGVRMYFSVLMDSGQYQKTEAAADRYMEKPEFKAWVSSAKALALMKQGFVEQAQSLFREAFKTVPSEDIGYVIQRMLAAYDVVPTIDRVKNWSETDRPGDWRVYVVLGDLYRGRGDFTQAIDAYQKARQLASSDMERASASQSLGAIYYAMQNYHEAELAYLEVLKSYPSDLAALNNLAYMYTENLNQPEKALPYAEKAARLLSTDGNVLDTYGWTLLKLGKLSEAENQLSRSVQILSSQAPNRYHLGLVHEQRGRLAEARSQFEKALEIAQEQKDTVLETSIRDALERVRRKIAGEE
jgi:tetratricopeptide (TPR) repeat protein